MIRRDPFSPGWSWGRQRKIKDCDPLPDFVPTANCHDSSIARYVNLLHDNLNAEHIGHEGQSQMLLNHSQETDRLLLLIVSIYDRLLD